MLYTIVGLGLLWFFSGFPWLLNLPLPDAFVYYFSSLGVIGIHLAMIIVMIYNIRFTTEHKTKVVSYFSLFFNSVLIGFVILELFHPSRFYNIEKVNGKWVAFTHPMASFILLLAMGLFTYSFILVFQELKRLPELLPSDYSKYSLAGAIVLVISIVFGFLSTTVFVSLPPWNIVLSLLSRTSFFIFMGLLLFLFYKSPLYLYSLTSSVQQLLDDGYIGWICVAMSDMGPKVLNYNQSWAKRYKITSEELLGYATAALVSIGLAESFEESLFLLPFPRKNSDLFALSYSFFHHDPLLKDPRFNGESLATFGIVFPFELVHRMDYRKWPEVIRKWIQLTSTIHEFASTENLNSLTLQSFNVLL